MRIRKKKLKPIKEFEVQFMGKSWAIRILTKESYEKEFPGTDGITLHSNQDASMVMPEGGINAALIRHECLHMCLFSLPIASARPNARQLEEIVADLLGDRWAEYLQLNKDIVRGLRRRGLRVD